MERIGLEKKCGAPSRGLKEFVAFVFPQISFYDHTFLRSAVSIQLQWSTFEGYAFDGALLILFRDLAILSL